MQDSDGAMGACAESFRHFHSQSEIGNIGMYIKYWIHGLRGLFPQETTLQALMILDEAEMHPWVYSAFSKETTR